MAGCTWWVLDVDRAKIPSRISQLRRAEGWGLARFDVRLIPALYSGLMPHEDPHTNWSLSDRLQMLAFEAPRDVPGRNTAPQEGPGLTGSPGPELAEDFENTCPAGGGTQAEFTMGGRGSSRWGYRGDYVPKLTINDATEIRARGIFRQLSPREGRALHGRIEFTSAGPVDFTIDATSSPVTVSLRFSESLRAAGISLPTNARVWVVPTHPTYGGDRWWFVCPACGRRCGAIYCLPWGYSRSHGMVWACRDCQNLVYPSQREGTGERGLRKLRKILRGAGAAWSSNCLPRHRPKGMHRRTFQRLEAEAMVAFAAAAATRRTARVLRTGALWG